MAGWRVQWRHGTVTVAGGDGDGGPPGAGGGSATGRRVFTFPDAVVAAGMVTLRSPHDRVLRPALVVVYGGRTCWSYEWGTGDVASCEAPFRVVQPAIVPVVALPTAAAAHSHAGGFLLSSAQDPTLWCHVPHPIALPRLLRLSAAPPLTTHPLGTVTSWAATVARDGHLFMAAARWTGSAGGEASLWVCGSGHASLPAAAAAPLTSPPAVTPARPPSSTSPAPATAPTLLQPWAALVQAGILSPQAAATAMAGGSDTSPPGPGHVAAGADSSGEGDGEDAYLALLDRLAGGGDDDATVDADGVMGVGMRLDGGEDAGVTGYVDDPPTLMRGGQHASGKLLPLGGRGRSSLGRRGGGWGVGFGSPMSDVQEVEEEGEDDEDTTEGASPPRVTRLWHTGAPASDGTHGGACIWRGMAGDGGGRAPWLHLCTAASNRDTTTLLMCHPGGTVAVTLHRAATTAITAAPGAVTITTQPTQLVAALATAALPHEADERVHTFSVSSRGGGDAEGAAPPVTWRWMWGSDTIHEAGPFTPTSWPTATPSVCHPAVCIALAALHASVQGASPASAPPPLLSTVWTALVGAGGEDGSKAAGGGWDSLPTCVAAVLSACTASLGADSPGVAVVRASCAAGLLECVAVGSCPWPSVQAGWHIVCPATDPSTWLAGMVDLGPPTVEGGTRVGPLPSRAWAHCLPALTAMAQAVVDSPPHTLHTRELGVDHGDGLNAWAAGIVQGAMTTRASWAGHAQRAASTSCTSGPATGMALDLRVVEGVTQGGAACTALTKLSGGHGLGVLTAQGLAGRASSEVAQTAQAYSAIINAAVGTGDHASGAPVSDDQDGLDGLSRVDGVPARRDWRLRSLARGMRTSRPQAVALRRKADTSDHDFLAQQQAAGLFGARRNLASAAGRACLTSATALANMSFPLRMPVTTIATRMAPSGNVTKLDGSGIASSTVGILDMAELWNGFAAGLRVVLPPGAESQPTRVAAWIKSHRFTGLPPDLGAVATTTAAIASGLSGSVPTAGIAAAGIASGTVPPNPAHAGMLFAFGLRAWLRHLTAADLLELLAPAHGLTSACVLLGGGIGAAGSQDVTLTKAALLHLPSILPGHHHDDLDVPALVQSCAMMGMGWLHLGSGHSLMSLYCLREMAGAHHMDRAEDRESFPTCAGFAFGLLHVGRGGTWSRRATTECESGDGRGGAPTLGRHHARPGMPTSLMEEGESKALAAHLSRLFLGGPDDSVRHRQSHWVGDGRVFGFGAHATATASKPVTLLEARRINVNATAPGAIVATGLTYLRTGNADVAATLALPDTLPRLDEVRYDCAYLRVLARSLIMWHELDAIQAACDAAGRAGMPPAARAVAETAVRTAVRRWVEGQVPPVVRRIMRRLYADSLDKAGGGGMTAALMAFVMGGLPGAPAASNAGGAGVTDDGVPAEGGGGSTRKQVAGVWVDEQDGPLAAMDVTLVRMLYASCVSGACAALALRFAGSHNACVRDELLSHLCFFASCRNSSNKDAYAPWAHLLHVLNHSATYACLAVGQAVHEDITQQQLHGGTIMDPATAVHRVNEAIFPAHQRQPTVDGLLSAMPEPPLSYPLRYDATCRLVALPVLTKQQVKQRKVLPLNSALACGEANTCSMATAAIACAAAIVMSGSCDLTVMRLLREIRRRCDKGVTYGDHLALSVAMGLLGVGAGRTRLISRTPAQVAALLALLMPVWPPGSASNMYWPQLARMQWPAAEVLVVENRMHPTAAGCPLPGHGDGLHPPATVAAEWQAALDGVAGV